ncbi:putative reverse transcriptase domain-containing protein, partial [Tanacetum coccineum]
IELANDLMDQKLLTYAERQTDNKRKADDASRNNHGHQQPFKRQNVTKGNTNVANTQKGNRANPKGNGCFECGAPGHFKRDCPKLKNKDGGDGNAQGWVYAVGNAEKRGNASGNPDSNVITGTFLLNNHYASMLFDTGVDRSFISTAFSSLINIAPTPLEKDYLLRSIRHEVPRYIGGHFLEMVNTKDLGLTPLDIQYSAATQIWGCYRLVSEPGNLPYRLPILPSTRGKVDRLYHAYSYHHHQPISLSPPSAGERLASIRCNYHHLTTNHYHISNNIPPLVDRMDDIPESEQPPHKRFVSTIDAEARQQGISEVGYGLETVWIVEEEAYASREAWAHLIGLSQAVHHELQTHHDHLCKAQMVEILRVMRDMRRETSDMQDELLALRGQQRARQPGLDARIPDHQDASRDADSHI